MMGGDDAGFASGAVVLRADFTDAAALLKELLDHTQRHAKAVGDLGTSAFGLVVG